MNSEGGILRKETDRFLHDASYKPSGLIVRGQNGSTLVTEYKRVD